MNVSLDNAQVIFDRWFPFFNQVMKIDGEATLVITVEGLRASSFKALFYTVISRSIEKLEQLDRFEESHALTRWWSKWKIRSDSAAEKTGVVIVSTRSSVNAVNYTTIYSKEYGFSPLHRSGAHVLAPSTSQSNVLSDALIQPYEPDVFNAFALLKEKNRLSPPITLLGVSLGALPPDVESLYPSILIVENDDNSITIL
jgi:hypothetical protein